MNLGVRYDTDGYLSSVSHWTGSESDKFSNSIQVYYHLLVNTSPWSNYVSCEFHLPNLSRGNLSETRSWMRYAIWKAHTHCIGLWISTSPDRCIQMTCSIEFEIHYIQTNNKQTNRQTNRHSNKQTNKNQSYLYGAIWTCIKPISLSTLSQIFADNSGPRHQAPVL